MNKMEMEAFIKLVETFTELQYSDEPFPTNEDFFIEENNDINDINDIIEFKTTKKPIVLPNKNIPVDLTKVNVQAIKDKLHTAGIIRVGKFTVRVKKYNPNDEIKLDIEIYEDKKKKFNGHVTPIPEKININKDFRFKTREWKTYFKNTILGGSEIPIDTVVEIIRWLQIVYRLPAFL